MDKDKYLALLQDFHRQYKRSPKRSEISCATSICKNFGSWGSALEAAGLPVCRESDPARITSKYIKLLQAFYKQKKRAPKRREIPCTTAICKKFGSWNKALVAAGLSILREENPPKEKLIKSVHVFFATHKRSPRAIDCKKENGLYDTKTYYKSLNVDSWPKVLQSLNLPIYFECYKANDRNEIEILIEVSLFIRRNKITSARAYDQRKKKQKENLPSSFALVTKYGTWSNVLKQAGLALNKIRHNKKSFIKCLKILASIGSIPTLKEFAKHLKVPARSITEHLGPFNEFIISQGFTPRFNTPAKIVKSKCQLKELYIDFSKKNGYAHGAPSRALDESTEIYNSDVFLIRFGSMNELKLACGFEALTKSKKQLTTEKIQALLIEEYKLLSRKPTIEEIRNNKNLPSPTTIMRYFKSTSFKKVWQLVLSDRPPLQ
jgi:hypothetical protein